jgi:hypothetical protein
MGSYRLVRADNAGEFTTEHASTTLNDGVADTFVYGWREAPDRKCAHAGFKHGHGQSLEVIAHLH